MNPFKRYVPLCLLLIGALLSGCDKKFDEHNSLTNPLLGTTLLEQVSKNPDLSKFNEYLVSTGYDKVLASSKSFTVFAPTNAALQALDPAVINSDVKLKLFIANHIATQLFLTSGLTEPFLRIKSLNGKNVTFTKTSVDGSPIVSKDLYVGNGVLHTISTAIIPKISAWEYLMSTTSLQKAELTSLTYSVFDAARAEVTGIDPKTGDPIYKPGTGIFTTNRFLDRIITARKPNDISNEDSTFTYIVLTDAAFLAEKNKLQKYYALGSADSTDSLTKFNVIKDLSFRGLLDKDNFPAVAYSAGDSVRFRLDKNAVVQTIPVSNGTVYVMNSLNYDIATGTFDPYTKLKPITIEGELSTATFLSAKTTTRPVRKNPSGSIYTQLFVENPATVSYWTRFAIPLINSAKYKVIWRVVRTDNVPASKATPVVVTSEPVWYPMRVSFKSAALTPLPYIAKPGLVPVRVNNVQVIDADGKLVFAPDYSEVELGEYTVDKYYSNTLRLGASSTLPLFLVASTVTANGNNNLLLDYVKLVPLP